MIETKRSLKTLSKGRLILLLHGNGGANLRTLLNERRANLRPERLIAAP